LRTFDFPKVVGTYYNVGMWRKYKADPTQYAHVGRDLVNNSIKGAEIVVEFYEKSPSVNINYISIHTSNLIGTLTSWGTDGPSTVFNNLDYILKHLA